jgi:hypothetical protein
MNASRRALTPEALTPGLSPAKPLTTGLISTTEKTSLPIRPSYPTPLAPLLACEEGGNVTDGVGVASSHQPSRSPLLASEEGGRGGGVSRPASETNGQSEVWRGRDETSAQAKPGRGDHGMPLLPLFRASRERRPGGEGWV